MSSLLPLFQNKLIPWAQNNLEQRLIVAKPVIKKVELPDGVQLIRKKIPGKRVMIRQQRRYGNQRIYHAHWPEAGLHELEVPKLVCVTKGVTDYKAGEYTITCGEGHFILLPPLTPNTTGGRSHLEGERRKNGFCELLQIILYRDSIECKFCTSNGERHQEDLVSNCFIHHHQAAQLFHLFMEESLKGHIGDDLLQSHLLSAFLLFLTHEIKAERQIKLQSNTRKSTFADGPMQEIRDYIKAHLRQSLTIEKVARQMYMSPAHFTRYIRRETGQSFVDILTECRLEEAKILLRETDWTTAIIAHLLGFKSHTYFNALFRRHLGCSPGVYRKNVGTGKIDRK